jgi:hypothetical protein
MIDGFKGFDAYAETVSNLGLVDRIQSGMPVGHYLCDCKERKEPI